MGTLLSTTEKTQSAYLAAVIGLLLFTAVTYLATGVEELDDSEAVVALAPAPLPSPHAAYEDTALLVMPPGTIPVTTTTAVVPPGSGTRTTAVIIRITPARSLTPAGPSGTPTTTTEPPTPAPVLLAAPALAPATTTTTLAPPPVVTVVTTTTSTTTVGLVRPRRLAMLTPPTTRAPATPPSSLELVADSAGQSDEGGASWFGAPASTCAHKTLPKGTEVRVIRLSTGADTTCVVADRGPYVDGRVIDLSTDTFARLAPVGAGVIDVRIEW